MRCSSVSSTSRLQCSSGSFLPVSIHQPCRISWRIGCPLSSSHWIASVISSSLRADGGIARTASWMRLENRYTPTSARSEGGSAGFSTSRTMSPCTSNSATPKLRGSSTCASRICAAGGSPRLAELGRAIARLFEPIDEHAQVVLEHVVAEVHDEVVVAEEVVRDEHAVREAARRVLVDVRDLDAEVRAVADGGADLGRRSRRPARRCRCP